MNFPDKIEAMNQFQRVITLHPTEIFADRSRLQIARMHLVRKEYVAALDTLNGIVERRNDDLAAEALLLMGENYLSLKKPKDALQAFQDVVNQYAEFPLLVERGRLGAGECYERLRDRARARAMYQEIVKSGVDPGIRKDAQTRLKRMR